MDNPNIVRYLSQKCVQKRLNVNVMECIGVDAQGRKWQFYYDSNVSYSKSGYIIASQTPLYNFMQIENST